VLNLLNWARRTFDLGPGDMGLQVTSYGFDLSVFDILGLLGRGAGLYLADEAEQRDPELLVDVLLRRPITFWNSAPSTLDQLASLLPRHAGRAGTGQLRLVFLSGDHTPLSLPDRIRSVFPLAKLVSLGGATEATVWSNFFPVERVDPEWRSVPYGRPMDNARYYIVDRDLQPCPVEVEGDLLIAGECLCVGYLNRPGLTAERFVPDPFALRPGERMYRTGDRARYFPDGNICFMGRADRQIKVRGFRVEPGEVEHRLGQHPGVREAVVLVRPDPAGDDRLVAYVVPAGAARPTAAELRAHAAAELPAYMVPSAFQLVSEFPATANGKLDRDALAGSAGGTGDRRPDEPAPVPDLSAEVEALMAGLLGVEMVGADEDLWDLGATSFTMVQLSAALQKRYEVRLPVSVLVSEPTVAGIARHLGSVTGAASPPRSTAAAEEQSPVELFSPEQRQAFRDAGRSRRPRRPEDRVFRLEDARAPDERYRSLSVRREPGEGTVSREAFGRFLGLLRSASVDGRDRYLYPSAGATYAVQTYVHVRPDRVEGVGEGIYYLDPVEHLLQLVEDRPRIDRSVHFTANRPIFDRAAFEVYLVGQTNGIQPLYGADSELFLALEAGYMGQLLLTGQAECGIGLCPVGTLAFDRIRPQFQLDDGHRYLHAFLAGPLAPAEPAAAPTRHQRGDREAAVVGLAGRYPGAEGPDALWRNLSAGRRTIGPLPADRVPSVWGERPGPASGGPAAGGFLAGVDRFDSRLFRISPEEAAVLDPQLRLLLRLAWECLENGGYTPSSLARAGSVGVFVGVMWNDHERSGWDEWRLNGAARISANAAEIPSRISHFFDFRGPSLAVNTACASSLTALHLAVESLRRGECDAALAGAVNLFVHPYHLRLLAGLGMVSGGAGGGWAPGEGAGMVLLRPAGAAASGGDVVHGVIEATGVGHSGRTSRFGLLDAAAIAGSIDRTLAGAGLTPDDIDYVECAAAGADIADAVEIEALGRVMGRRARSGPVPLGTIKANIGHLEAASGLSQLTKVLLQLRHGQAAPSLLTEGPTPLVPWEELPLRPVTSLQPLRPAPGRDVLRALVNAVSATGAHGHVVVRSAPERGR
jgi:3-oxoacyl-(acyl-carrier-protein) synthase/acyl carrier protein